MWAQSEDSDGGRKAEAFAAEPSDLVSEVPAWVFFLVALSVGGVLALIITLTILSEGFKDKVSRTRTPLLRNERGYGIGGHRMIREY